jgi:hypothetical protein
MFKGELIMSFSDYIPGKIQEFFNLKTFDWGEGVVKAAYITLGGRAIQSMIECPPGFSRTFSSYYSKCVDDLLIRKEQYRAHLAQKCLDQSKEDAVKVISDPDMGGVFCRNPTLLRSYDDIKHYCSKHPEDCYHEGTWDAS